MKLVALPGLAAMLLFAAVAPASAAVRSSFSGAPGRLGTLTVESDDAADTVVAACTNDRVLVNGNPPDTGPVGCSQVVAVEAFGRGGDDRLDFRGISPRSETFRGVSARGLVDGGAGDDSIVGPGYGWITIIGGAGSDVMEGQGNAINLYRFDPAAFPEQDAVIEPAAPRCDPSYFDTNQPSVDWWTLGWDSLDFRSLPAADAVTVAEPAAAGLLAAHRNRTIRLTKLGRGRAFEAIAGGAGNDRIGSACMAIGGLGSDTLAGTASDGDLLLGGEGRDRLSGGGGQDVLIGGPGDDRLDGGSGPDALSGGPGDDAIAGGAGNDVYHFNLDDGRHTDVLREGARAGADTLSFGVSSPVSANLSTRSTLIARTSGLDVRVELGQARFFENVIGGAGNDRLIGNAAANHFWSGGGTDLVAGRTGDDVYHVDWTGSMPYAAYGWHGVWRGPFDRAPEPGRRDGAIQQTRLSVLRIREAAAGGVDTLDFRPRWFSWRGGGSLMEGQLRAGIRVDLSARTWISRAPRLGARAAEASTARHLENIRGSSYRDVLIGNAANNLLDGHRGPDRIFGGPGKDECLRRSREDFFRGCERIRR